MLVRLLRSVSATTGALLGLITAGLPPLAFTLADIAIGRPTSTEVLGFAFAAIYGVVGALIGFVVGAVVRFVVSRTHWSGPIDWRSAMSTAAMFAVVLTVVQVLAVANRERLNRPRVMMTTTSVRTAPATRVGDSQRAICLLDTSHGLPEGAPRLRWNSLLVGITLTRDGSLSVTRDDAPLTSVSLEGLDYVVQVYGTTASPQAGTPEWLALLVRLRATGSRDLFLLVKPDGTIAHEELFERVGRLDDPALWRAASNGEALFVVTSNKSVAYAITQ